VVSNTVVLGAFIFLGVYVLDDFYMVFERKPNAVLFVSIRGITSIILIYIVLAAIHSYKKAQEVALQNQMLKTENIRAQFELLRQQVNPHFLFNSLSTLRAMIRSGNPDSELFVIKLAEMYRNLLAKRENETSTLSEELDFVNNYSFMLFARFKDMLQIKRSVDEALLNHTLPTFCLQLLVENCIKHNSISSDKPLTIHIFTTNDQRVCVQNQLHPKFTRDVPSGFGISNLKKRFEMLGVTNGINVVQNDSMFKVEVKLISAQGVHSP
jgi:LytS/YehU family sensor histidine kinase